MSILYERLLTLCKDRGISGYRMSKDNGIALSLMTDLKMGRKKGISAEVANKLASYFGVTVGYLLGTEPEPLLTLDPGNAALSMAPETEKAPALQPEDEREAEILRLFRGLSEAEQERELAFLRERAGGKDT
ncbi:helix-turn-helix domain-containing protein [Dysosmobacter sp.]|uniref:helix-turn-helix domain-containing protein n=1 Tax=Dysosmobacter sp. TaxID=2591382 RepID=UPI002A953499|nr:helix-turn-helix domain-containing protein [Dysosmobacter sp.]MDY5510164.1 helix-turn-helix domain-containing protein [Dysosmobacter sp.]